MNYSLAQRMGLTGKLLGSRVPANIKDRYDLSRRQNITASPDVVGPEAAMEPDIGGAPGPYEGSDVSRSPNQIGGVPTGDVGQMNITKADVRNFALGAAPVGVAMLTGGASIPATAFTVAGKGLQAAGIGRAASYINQKAIQPAMSWLGSKTGLGRGGRYSAPDVTQKDLEASFPGPAGEGLYRGADDPMGDTRARTGVSAHSGKDIAAELAAGQYALDLTADWDAGPDRGGMYSAPDVTQSDLESSFPGPGGAIDDGWFSGDDDEGGFPG